MTPEAGETSTRSFLRQLKVAAHPDSYENDYLGGVKTFDREANRYGRNYSYANDFNNQRPTWPLANPELNVNTGATDESFVAVDAVGMGAPMHYRVVDTKTREYVTRQMHQEDAEQIAHELNQVKFMALQESGPTRKHFQATANIVRAIEDPKRRQEFADHHAALFATQNPRFDHAKWHAACGTQHVKVEQRNEAKIPSTALQEGLFQPLNPKYLDALNKSITHARNFTMDGGKYQSTNTDITAMAAFKATTLLQERSKAKFEDKPLTEQDAVRSRQSKANPRPNQSRLERLVTGASSDKEFLNEMNSRSLLPK
jgi:hypothetical protein